MKAYKLFRKRKDGTLGPLFINARQRVPVGEWLEAEDKPTKSYAHRPGWHSGVLPQADHLTERDRVWCEVEIDDYYPFKRPAHQGGEWLISKMLKVVRELTTDEVLAIRSAA